MRNLSELFSCIIIDVSVSKFSSEKSASSALLRLNLWCPRGGKKQEKKWRKDVIKSEWQINISWAFNHVQSNVRAARAKNPQEMPKIFCQLTPLCFPSLEWVPHRPTQASTLCGQCAQSWPQFEFDAFCLVAAYACPVSSALPLSRSLSSTSFILSAKLWNIRVQCLYKFCIIFAILLRTLSQGSWINTHGTLNIFIVLIILCCIWLCFLQLNVMLYFTFVMYHSTITKSFPVLMLLPQRVFNLRLCFPFSLLPSLLIRNILWQTFYIDDDVCCVLAQSFWMRVLWCFPPFTSTTTIPPLGLACSCYCYPVPLF